ncbi:MAG: hypothetical protein HC913_00695 [Microscillaceae bacterium]|nr:hypothetical protein [Microscillaceae bacterium]
MQYRPYLLILCQWLLSAALNAQENQPSGADSWALGRDGPFFFWQDSSSAQTRPTEALQQYLDALQAKWGDQKPDKALARRLFFKVSGDYLKNYAQFTSLLEVLDQQSFDCVSGSALLGLAYAYWGFAPEIHETATHVYILLHFCEQDRVLVESTAGQMGFIDAEADIDRARAVFQGEVLRIGRQSFRFDRQVDLRQLAGLQYYNLGVATYNQGQLLYAQRYLQMALELYPEDRIQALQALCQARLAFQP